jgi:DHA1 family bicyclomycin/chloramphenicol resistance-like MFS transporter
MVIGITIASIASLAAAFATSITALTIARIAQSFGASTGLVVGRAMIRDLYGREHATAMIGLVTTAMVVVPMLTPLVGGVIDTSFGWRSIFLFLTLVGAAVVTWSIFSLPESRELGEGSAKGRFRADLRVLGGSPLFVAYVLVAAFGTAPFFAFLGGGPYVVVTMMGRTSAEYGVWFAIPAVGFMLGNFIASRLASRVGLETMLWWGAGLTIVGTLLATVLVWLIPDSGPGPVFLPQILTSFANGMLLPNAIAGAVSVRPQAAGTASGITGFTQMAIGAASVQLATLVLGNAETAIALTLLMLAFGVLTALACLILLLKPRTD